MTNSISFEAKGKTKGATDLPKPISAYSNGKWGQTDKLNVGLYNVPSTSNREKFNTYRVGVLKAGKANGNGKTAKQVPQFANALALLCKQYGVKL